ncbi:YozE SAM-like fold [Arenibacter nanhaiticus]|uniref:YozE SAM-like fold n=1 Tax=Arenibacter nanhaiticus TaxID=558155 RepID=A0A1M6KVA0_9FLAO|nr:MULTISPECIES: YozE family protein [Arenibacter]NKI28303.1 hypothetical protein [Arenibacter sp. 6A1]SHJ62931.1 YozE SAM-like fold [Arenibacter nanhaiticus]
MTLRKYIQECSKKDSHIGDLANDILRDNDFPFKKHENEIWKYLDSKTLLGGTNDIFLEFWKEYQKIKDEKRKNLSGWSHSIIATECNTVVSITNRDFNDPLAGFLHELFDITLNTQRNRIVTHIKTVGAEQLTEVLRIFNDYQQYKEIEFLKPCLSYLRKNDSVNSLTLTFHNN